MANFDSFAPGLSRTKAHHKVKRLFLTLATREDLALFVTGLSLESDNYWKNKWDPAAAFNASTFGPHRLKASQVIQALQNLKTLSVDRYWSEILLRDDDCRGIGPFRLMIQPNLKEITLKDVSLGSSMADLERKTFFLSNMSHITLIRPWTGVDGLTTLIRMTKHLRSLKLNGTSRCRGHWTSLEYHTCGNNPSAQCNLGIPVTLNTVEHCLEVLMVKNFERGGCYNPVLDPIRLRTLQNFRTLRDVKIDASMILGTRQCPTLYAQSDALRNNNNNNLQCEEIARCMPASLQRLYLTISREQLDRDDQYCKGIVNSFLNYKNQLPEMTTLVMEERRPRYAPICYCIVENLCYAAKDAIKSSSPVDDILQMQQDCSKSGIGLSYFSRPVLLADARRFAPGQAPQRLGDSGALWAISDPEWDTFDLPEFLD